MSKNGFLWVWDSGARSGIIAGFETLTEVSGGLAPNGSLGCPFAAPHLGACSQRFNRLPLSGRQNGGLAPNGSIIQLCNYTNYTIVQSCNSKHKYCNGNSHSLIHSFIH